MKTDFKFETTLNFKILLSLDKSVYIRSYFDLYFPAFARNTERLIRMVLEYGEINTDSLSLKLIITTANNIFILFLS